MFAGCNGDGDTETEAISSEDISEEMTQDEPQVIEFVTNGASEFIIWVADELFSDDSVIAEITALNSVIKSKTGITLEVKSDSSYSNSSASKPAILIGNTAFSESRELGENMKNRDYRINMIDGKIVLVGADSEKLITAIKYFRNQVVSPQNNEDGTLVFTEEKIFMSDVNYGISKVTLGGSELKDYRIVVSSDASAMERLIANELKAHLTQEYGYTLEIVDDGTSSQFLEVLVGNTSRTNVSAGKHEFIIDFESGKLQLAASDIRGYEALEEYLFSTFLYAKNKKEYVYEDGYSYSGKAENILADGTLCASEKLGDVRCMFYNVYGWVGYGPNDVRLDLQKQLISAYAPDVLCFQEYADFYHADFTSLLTKMGYSDASVNTTYINNTPLFYNTKTLNLVESGCHLFTGPNNSNTKSLTWAVLQTKNGERFIAISMHLMYDMKGLEDPNAVRVENVKEVMSVIDSIRSKSDYDQLPLIMGGDFNAYLDSDPQNLLISKGYKYAWNEAQSKNDTKGLHSWSIWSDEEEMWSKIPAIEGDHTKAIDHAFVDGDITVKRYAAVTSKVALWVSDHMPLFVDIDI